MWELLSEPAKYQTVTKWSPAPISCYLPALNVLEVDRATVELPLDLLDLVHLEADHPQHLRHSGLAPAVVQHAAVFTNLEWKLSRGIEKNIFIFPSEFSLISDINKALYLKCWITKLWSSLMPIPDGVNSHKQNLIRVLILVLIDNW